MYKPALLHFKFEDFASLSSETGASVYSEVQTDCNGHKWNIKLYPGGKSTTETGWIGLWLFSKNEEALDTKYTLSVKDEERETVKGIEIEWNLTVKEGYGGAKIMKRSVILDAEKNILKDGALCIDVTLQVKDKADDLYDSKESERHQEKMLKLLVDKKNTDIKITVGGEIFCLHSLILENNAPLLAEYCKQKKGANNDINSDVFLMILEYVYSGFRPYDNDIIAFGKELIDAANRFELVELKLAIEKVLVCERILNKANVADYILFADAQSCPLLKEYAISYFLLHAKEILNSGYSRCLRESGELLSEIIKLMADKGEDGMDVNELRVELSKRELDVDGSKEALMSRLKEAKRQRTD